MVARRLAPILATAAILGACSDRSGDDPSAAKGGSADSSVTLTVAHIGLSSRLDQFAADANELSNGELAIDVSNDLAALGPAAENAIVDAVTEGTYDLALVPTRAWSANGVDSMRILQAPFETRSPEHMRAIAGDDRFVEHLFAGLDDRRLHGLALVPEELRYLFSFRGPITTVDDLDGVTVRVFTADLEPSLAAMGASWVNPPDDEFVAAVARNEIAAADSSLSKAHDTLPAASFVAADLPLYGKFLSLVANDAAWSSLSDAQRAAVTRSALQLRDGVDLVPSAEAAAAFCAAGGVVVMAGPSEVARFRSAVSPVAESFDAALLEAMRDLASTAPAEPVACDGRLEAPLSGDEGAIPEGLYRGEGRTTDELAAIGVSAENQEAWATDYVELELRDGIFTERYFVDGQITSECRFDYASTETTLTLTGNGDCGASSHLLTATWNLDGDRLIVTDDPHARGDWVYWFASYGPITRIG